MPMKNFYSGSGLNQALLAAARDLGVEPEALAFVQRPKRHGFLRGPRVVIEVDPAAPRRERMAVPAPEPRPAAAGEPRERPRNPARSPQRAPMAQHDEARIAALAQDAIAEVRQSGRPALTIELNPAERRIVHLVVRESGLVTESQGEGRLRAVLVSLPAAPETGTD